VFHQRLPVSFAIILATCLIMPAQTPPGGAGPDVIVIDLPELNNYGPANGYHAYAVGTNCCNIGTTPLNWFANNNDHPVIAQQLYRIRDGVFRQVGMAWLKHGFGALQLNLCGSCTPHPNFNALGVGCSDPYTAGLNGQQSNLGPRNEVNASTGVFPYPPTYGANIVDATSARLRAPSSLVESQPAGTRFLIEGHYVTKDDAAAGNQLNNASYREAQATSDGQLSLVGTTTPQEPAIMGWPTIDPGVTVVHHDVAGDGRFYLGANIINLGGGMNRYVLALHNYNSDLAAGQISVAMPAGATVSNLQFFDADYHSGEQFQSADWVGAATSGAVTWTSPDNFATSPDGAALRWGSSHTFVFESDTHPGDITVTHYKNNQTFTFPAAPPPAQPDFMVNQPAASADIDGLTNNGLVGPIRKTLNFGGNASINFSSDVTTAGSLQDIFVQSGDAHPASGSGTAFPGGQIVNLDLSQPMSQLWNWQPTTSSSIPFTAPPVPLDLTAQMAVTDTSSAIGFHVSAAVELDVVACTPTTITHTIGDDDAILVSLGSGGLHDCIASVSLYGVTYSDVFINSNGSVSMNAGATSFAATTAAFLSEMPRVAGHWSDLDPTSGGTVQSVSNGSDLTIQFMNVPEWGSTNTATFDVVFAASGDVTIGNHSVSSSWGTASLVGFSPGNNATGNAVVWSSAVGSSLLYGASDAVYEHNSSGSVGGFSSITLSPGNTITVN